MAAALALMTAACALPAAASVSTGDYTTTAQSYLSLRSGAGTSYREIERLNKGTRVTVISDAGDWAYVFVPVSNEYGYVYDGYLAAYGENSDASVSGTEKEVANLQSGYLAVRTAPSAQYENEIQSTKLYNGDTVRVTGDRVEGTTFGGCKAFYVWVYVPKTGVSGYVNEAFLK